MAAPLPTHVKAALRCQFKTRPSRLYIIPFPSERKLVSILSAIKDVASVSFEAYGPFPSDQIYDGTSRHEWLSTGSPCYVRSPIFRLFCLIFVRRIFSTDAS